MGRKCVSGGDPPGFARGTDCVTAHQGLISAAIAEKPRIDPDSIPSCERKEPTIRFGYPAHFMCSGLVVGMEKPLGHLLTLLLCKLGSQLVEVLLVLLEGRTHKLRLDLCCINAQLVHHRR